MTQPTPNSDNFTVNPDSKRGSRLPVVIAAIILIVIVGVFVVEFIVSSAPPFDAPTPEPVSVNSYADRVSSLLATADPANGDALVTKYECVACHRLAGENVAPPFAGIAERALERRTPMPAAAYLYESITIPGAYLVEGYADAMPQNFAARIPDDELGDIIAYLLTPDAH